MDKLMDKNGKELENGMLKLDDRIELDSELDALAEKLFISVFSDTNFTSGRTSVVADFCYQTAQDFLNYRESRKQNGYQ